MKTYDEIKTILIDQLGLKDLAAYERWSKAFCWSGQGPMATPRKPIKADIELLSPDLIDNRAFWTLAEELFQTDPVSNCNGTRPYDVAEANRTNLRIYHWDGFTGLAQYAKDSWAPSRIPLLEIGPGYGAFKDWLAALGGFDYHGVDVRPRIPGVDLAGEDGLMEYETTQRRYAMVIASNVFQHLSVKQRRAYYEAVERCLLPTGLFMVSMMLDSGSVGSEFRCEDGHVWCRHYGQLTQIQREHEILSDLREHFLIERVSIRKDAGWITVTCAKRDGRRYAS